MFRKKCYIIGSYFQSILWCETKVGSLETYEVIFIRLELCHSPFKLGYEFCWLEGCWVLFQQHLLEGWPQQKWLVCVATKNVKKKGMKHCLFLQKLTPAWTENMYFFTSLSFAARDARLFISIHRDITSSFISPRGLKHTRNFLYPM